MRPEPKLVVVPRKKTQRRNVSSDRRAQSAGNSSIPAGVSSFRSKHPLQAASHPLVTLAKTFDEFLFEFDAEGRFLGVWSSNPAVTRARRREFLGRHAKEVLGKEVFRPFS